MCAHLSDGWSYKDVLTESNKDALVLKMNSKPNIPSFCDSTAGKVFVFKT